MRSPEIRRRASFVADPAASLRLPVRSTNGSAPQPVLRRGSVERDQGAAKDGALDVLARSADPENDRRGQIRRLLSAANSMVFGHDSGRAKRIDFVVDPCDPR
jgi:hypothetical protein